jgi:hypothetical protein
MKILKIPSIKVYDTEAYFALPLSERTWKGLYKVPYSLPSEMFSPEEKGWNTFYEQIKKQFPIQYFFRQWLFSLDNPLILFYKCYISWSLRDFKFAIKNFIKPCCPRWRKVLPRHQYKDITQIIPESYFALILDFYYEEVLDGFVDWDADETHRKFKKELIKHVQWIEKGQAQLREKLDKALSEATENRIKDKNGNVNYKATYRKYNTLEQKMKKQVDEILIWVINNREGFWT